MSPATKLIERMKEEMEGDERVDLTLAPLDDREISVEHLDVKPSFRGSGLARSTMERLSELADEAGIELFLYASVPKNVEPGLDTADLRSFYARLGYGCMDTEDLGHMRRLPDPMRQLAPIPNGRRLDP